MFERREAQVKQLEEQAGRLEHEPEEREKLEQQIADRADFVTKLGAEIRQLKAQHEQDLA
jgi:hypothetical protein